jgi:hypothetical protein
LPGSQPANDTRPDAGAATGASAGEPTSMPEWPRSWYSAPPNSKARRTGPSVGQLQADAPAGAASASSSALAVVVIFVNI